jgi:pimeloyl-ACP methyl ester carboxylesterase
MTTTSPVAKRRKRRSPVLVLIRILATILLVFTILVVIGAWYYSNQIESGALAPPTPGETYDWTVEQSGSYVTLTAADGTDQAGEPGRSGLWWPDGYSKSSALIATTQDGGTVADIRSLEPGQVGPPTGTDVKVDMYYHRGDPQTVHGLTFETVYYTSDVGTFPAWFVPSTQPSSPNSRTWAIFVHGKGATLEESLRIMPFLHERGHPILVITYRNDVGEARDPSGYHQYGLTEWVDLAEAVRYARDNGAADHVLVGYSYGGSVIASYLTQSPLRNFTRAVILDSPVLSFEDTVDFRAANTDVPIFGFAVPEGLTNIAKWIASWRFDIDWQATDYVDQTASIHAPILIFHGTRDISVPLSTSREMATRRPDITTLVVTEAGHTRSWNIDDVAYAQEIDDFLDGQG